MMRERRPASPLRRFKRPATPAQRRCGASSPRSGDSGGWGARGRGEEGQREESPLSLSQPPRSLSLPRARKRHQTCLGLRDRRQQRGVVDRGREGVAVAQERRVGDRDLARGEPAGCREQRARAAPQEGHGGLAAAATRLAADVWCGCSWISGALSLGRRSEERMVQMRSGSQRRRRGL